MSLELRFTTPFRATPVMRAFRSRMQAGTYLAEFMDDLPAYEFKDPFTARHIRSGCVISTSFPITEVLKEAVIVNFPDEPKDEPQHEQSVGPRKSLADVAREFKVEPRVVRQKLRKAARMRDKFPELNKDASRGARWEWDTSATVYKEVVRVLEALRG